MVNGSVIVSPTSCNWILERLTRDRERELVNGFVANASEPPKKRNEVDKARIGHMLACAIVCSLVFFGDESKI